jgi:hypothetical protein
MEEFIKNNLFAVISLLLTLAAFLVHVGVSKQKFASLLVRVEAAEDALTSSAKTTWQVAQHAENLSELRREQHTTTGEISLIKGQLGIISSKLDLILKHFGEWEKPARA